MMGSPQFGLPPANGRYLFSATEQYLKADVSIVDQEGTLTDVAPSKCAGSSSSECFAFKTPPSYASEPDRGRLQCRQPGQQPHPGFRRAGLTDTEAALKAVHLPSRAAGTIRHPARGQGGGGGPRVRAVHVVRELAGPARCPGVGGQARRKANLVIVYFHAGAQGAEEIHVGPGPESVFGDPQGDIRVLAHAFVDAGADMVIGTGPHVLRGIEFYKGKMIDYSLGNFLGYRGFGLGGNLSTSAVLQATITAGGKFVTARLRPVELDGDGVPSPGGYGVSLVRTVSGEDFGSSAARISASRRDRAAEDLNWPERTPNSSPR